MEIVTSNAPAPLEALPQGAGEVATVLAAYFRALPTAALVRVWAAPIDRWSSGKHLVDHAGRRSLVGIAEDWSCTEGPGGFIEYHQAAPIEWCCSSTEACQTISDAARRLWPVFCEVIGLKQAVFQMRIGAALEIGSRSSGRVPFFSQRIHLRA